MCVYAGNSILFNQVRYEHPHHIENLGAQTRAEVLLFYSFHLAFRVDYEYPHHKAFAKAGAFYFQIGYCLIPGVVLYYE